MDSNLIDADNHYYESEDAFTRYGDDEVKRFVRWMSEGKRRHLLFGNVVQTMVPNPTFNPITKPGAFHQRLKELAQHDEGAGRGAVDPSRYGELEPLPDHYQQHEARLRVMDEQGLERAFLFPTLAVGIEGLNPTEVPITYKVFRAFNEWLDDDWGFVHEERLYAAPAIPVLDPVRATEELERVPRARGATHRAAARTGQREVARRPGLGSVLGAPGRGRGARRLPRLRRHRPVRRRLPSSLAAARRLRPCLRAEPAAVVDR